MEHNIRAAEDLAVIRRIMESSRELVENDGKWFVLWGGACAAGTGISYLLIALSLVEFIPVLWSVVTVAVIVSGIAGDRRRKTGRPRSIAGSILGAAWAAVIALGAAVSAGAALAGVLDLSFAMGIVSACVAAGYIVTAWAVRSRMIGVLSVLWWAGGVLLPAMPGYGAPAVLGLMTFFLEFVPGLVMLRTARRIRSLNGNTGTQNGNSGA